MYGYAGSSAAAAQVTPFAPPPRSTNPAGTAGQAAAVAQATGGSAATNTESALPQLMSAVPQSLQVLTAPSAAAAADPPSLLSAFDSALTGPLGPVSLFGIGGSPYLLGVENYLVPQNVANVNSAGQRLDRDRSTLSRLGGGADSGTRVVSSPGPGGAGMSTGVGRAGVVGRLSVPQAWTAAAPEIRPVAVVLPQTTLVGAPAALAADGQGTMFGNMAASGLAGRAMSATGTGPARAMGFGSTAFGRSATTATIIVINADDTQD